MTGEDENCVPLYFTDCIVQAEQKGDASVVLSCLEEALHASRKQFPHVNKLIAQSDNGKNRQSCSCLMIAQLLG